MRKLKILLSTHHSGLRTGSGVQLYLLARELVQRGHKVSAAFKSKAEADEQADPTLAKLEAAGVEVIRLPFAKLKYRFTLPALAELGAYLFEKEFDIIHCFAGMDLNYFFLLSSFVPMGAIISNRGTFEPLDIFNSIKYRSGRVKKILAVSAAVKDSLIQSGWVSPEKIEVSYSAVDLNLFDPALDGRPVRQELGLQEDGLVVGAIGSFRFMPGHLKGGMELLTASRLILEKHPQTQFLLVGDINRELFLKAAVPLGIADRFTLTGFREDVPRLLAACDLTLVPSLFAEGLNGTIREAMAMKKPVVATDVGGNSELVIDNVTGKLVPPGDVQALAQAACELIERPGFRAALGEAGRQKVESCCSLAARVKRIEEIYYESLSPDNQPRVARSWQKTLHRLHRASSPLFTTGPRYLRGWRPAPTPSGDQPASRRAPFIWRLFRRLGPGLSVVSFVLGLCLLGLWSGITLEYLFWGGRARNFSGEVSASIKLKNPQEFRLTFMGDSRGSDVVETLLEQARASSDAAVIMGDLVDHASQLEFLFAQVEIAEGADHLPVFTGIGNHDLDPRKNGDLYRKLFGPDHYWLRFGRVLFLAMNNVEPGRWPEQIGWLSQTLSDQGAAAEKIFLMIHKPPASSEVEGMESEQSQELMKILQPYKPKMVVLASHLHQYAELNWEGIPLYITGEAGAPQEFPPSFGYLQLTCSQRDCRIQHQVFKNLTAHRAEKKVMVDFLWSQPFLGAAGLAPLLWRRKRGRSKRPLLTGQKTKSLR